MCTSVYLYFQAVRMVESDLQLEYLDVTVLRRGVGEVRVVAGRAPAC
jgi:hypothetical protein